MEQEGGWSGELPLELELQLELEQGTQETSRDRREGTEDSSW